jgi:DNA segregation ATPase FtsK/SpoIIIE-like protein
MLVALCDAYTPDDLQLIILDLKGKFADFTNAAHLRGLSIARTEPDFNRLMAYVSQQIKDREAVSDFEARRIVVVIDEAEAILQDRARLQIARALVTRGREVRINGLFATQDPHKGRFKDLLGQINNRWVGLLADADASWRVTGHKGKRAHELSGEGDFLHLVTGDVEERLQVAMVTQADYDRLPRAEIAPPAVLGDTDPVDPDRLPPAESIDRSPPEWDTVDDGHTGRPRNEIIPETLAYYLHRGPDAITTSQAREELELSRYGHRQYKAFARRTLEKLRELKDRSRDNGR